MNKYSGDFATNFHTTILHKQSMPAIASPITASSVTLPLATFEGSFIDVYEKSGLMRSVDWIEFLQAVVPTLVFEQLVHEYTSSAEQVNTIMSPIIESTLALQWNIDQEDLANINTHLHTWHLHMKNNVSTNMYNVNFHYLRHIHDTCLKRGPLRSYSTRSAERAIGFFKRHIKQRVLPGSNAANIIKRHLITCAYHRMYVEEDVVEEVEEDEDEDGNDQYTIPNANQELELWDWHHATLDLYSSNDSRVLTSTLDNRIRVGKRLFKTDTVFRCKEYPGMARKLDTLVKLRLPIRGRSNSTAFYFGELMLFFTYQCQGDERQLCLERAQNMECPMAIEQAQTLVKVTSFIVTGCENILDYTGLIQSSFHPGRYYVVYPDMMSGHTTLANICDV
ncbi:hypothetical protein INT45_009862 [Circinella minor]|uniref:Uncharacterized protein n=1 Tax=Circinella minor TaxID=1195481 RepID=A0A8H7RWS2_9FUNG|nr:hypothetical protein INT45_009862 [Circinella minor]